MKEENERCDIEIKALEANLSSLRALLDQARKQEENYDHQLEDRELKIEMYQSQFDEQIAELRESHGAEIKRLKALISELMAKDSEKQQTGRSVKYLRPIKISVETANNGADQRDVLIDKLAKMEMNDDEVDDSKTKLEFRILQRELDKFRDLHKSSTDRNSLLKTKLKAMEDDIKSLQTKLKISELEVEKMAKVNCSKKESIEADSGLMEDIDMVAIVSDKKKKKRNKKAKKRSLGQENLMQDVANKDFATESDNLQGNADVRRPLYTTQLSALVK